MGCSACARRRKALEAKRKAKQAQGKPLQAAALGAVLAVTETVGKAIGASGEDADGNQSEMRGDGNPPGTSGVRDNEGAGHAGGAG